MNDRPLKAFVVYSSKDKKLREELETHLTLLVKQGYLTIWSDKQILPGEEWDKAIKRQLNDAELILMLISIDFFNSAYIEEEEFQTSLQRLNDGKAIVVPIIVRDCDWKADPVISSLQLLPSGGIAVTDYEYWKTTDKAWTDVARRIRGFIDIFREKRRHQEVEEKAKKERELETQRIEEEKLLKEKLMKEKLQAEQRKLEEEKRKKEQERLLLEKQRQEEKARLSEKKARIDLENREKVEREKAEQLKREQEDVEKRRIEDEKRKREADRLMSEQRLKEDEIRSLIEESARVKEESKKRIEEHLQREKQYAEKRKAEEELHQKETERLLHEQKRRELEIKRLEEERNKIVQGIKAKEKTTAAIFDTGRNSYEESTFEEVATSESFFKKIAQNKKILIGISLSAIAVFAWIGISNRRSKVPSNAETALPLKDTVSLNISPKNENLSRDITKDMILIKGGTFYLGNLQENNTSTEDSLHQITLKDFYLGKYEVTFEDFDKYCDATSFAKPFDKGWGRGLRPVIHVSWLDAVQYCNWLSIKNNLTPCYTIKGNVVTCDWDTNGFRLPTEAEWEYAAKVSSGKTEVWSGTSDRLSLYKYANFCDSLCVANWKTKSQGDGYVNTAEVGKFQSNSKGLFDMTGNVWEWCWDRYSETYLDVSPTTNPTGPNVGSNRVLRGGSWFESPDQIKTTYHQYTNVPSLRFYTVGFRLAQSKK